MGNKRLPAAPNDIVDSKRASAMAAERLKDTSAVLKSFPHGSWDGGGW